MLELDFPSCRGQLSPSAAPHLDGERERERFDFGGLEREAVRSTRKLRSCHVCPNQSIKGILVIFFVSVNVWE